MRITMLLKAYLNRRRHKTKRLKGAIDFVHSVNLVFRIHNARTIAHEKFLKLQREEDEDRHIEHAKVKLLDKLLDL